MPTPPPSKLDANQVLQGSFDESTGRLRTDSLSTIVNADIDVSLDATEDNVEAWVVDENGNPFTDANYVPIGQSTHDNINANANIQVNNTDVSNANPVPISDAGGSITVDGTVSAAQSGTWNITNVSGTVSLPTGAATSALQTTGNTTLSTISSTLSGTLTTKITDTQSARDVEIGSFRELKTGEWTRLVGGNAVGTTINARLWSTPVIGSGSVTSGSGLFLLSTGTTANSSAIHQSIDVCRYISGSTNVYLAGIRCPTIGVANNERRWGAWTSTDGIYFKLSGSTLSCCRLQGGVETEVTVFNGTAPVVDTNFHTYEIMYTAGSAQFYQDRVRIHTLVTSTSSLADTIYFPLRAENKNINGGTTNTTLQLRGIGIHRFGRPVGRPHYDFINTASTSTIKREAGTLHKVFINRSTVAGTSNVTIYDSVTGSGTIIAVITLANIENNTIEFDIDFNTGLTIVSDSSLVQLTIVWE